MLEKYQTLQQLCYIAVTVFAILSAIAGYGIYYYGIKIDKVKTAQNQVKIGGNTLNVTGDVKPKVKTSHTENKVDFEQKDNNIDIKDNKGVVSFGQVGNNTVTNTTNNYNVDLPKPYIEVKWLIQNEVVTNLGGRGNRNIDIKEKFNVDSLYKNRIEVNYTSRITRDELFIIFGSETEFVAYDVQMYPGGRLQYGGQYVEDGRYVVALSQPSSSTYHINVYSKDKWDSSKLRFE